MGCQGSFPRKMGENAGVAWGGNSCRHIRKQGLFKYGVPAERFRRNTFGRMDKAAPSRIPARPQSGNIVPWPLRTLSSWSCFLGNDLFRVLQFDQNCFGISLEG